MSPTRSRCLIAGALFVGFAGCNPFSCTSTGSTTGSTGSTSSTGQSGRRPTPAAAARLEAGADYSWPQWPVPPDSPPTSEYTTTTDMVTDTVTGLMWQRVVPSGTYTWQQAKDYCSTLTLAGLSGWRLPTRIELVSIVDYGTSNPAINSTVFPNTPMTFFWTSSPYAANAGDAWIVDSNSGDTNSNSMTKTSVRCVRGGSGVMGGAATSALLGQYTVTADTVHDNKTGLTWQRAAASGTYTQPDGSSYCQALTLGGLSGWRLPTVKELQTIVDDGTYASAIDATAFPNNTPAGYFWTSSPYAYLAGYAWVVDFGSGFAHSTYTPVTHSVRCVR